MAAADPRFELCLSYILKEEGGNDDDPQDHGGRTSRGIIQKEYDRWRAAKGLPTRDVWTASDQEIHDIYYEEYWLPVCPRLAPGVDLAYFNIAVNAGVREAAVLLQRTLNIAENSVEFKSEHEYVGPLTLKYATAADARNLVGAFSDHIMSFYRSLKQFPRYGNDWTDRTGRIRSAALKMAPQSAVPSKPQEPTPMPTTSPTTVPAATTFHLPHIDFAMLEKFVESAAVGLGFIGMMYPPAKTVIAFVPVVEGFLNAADQIQKTVESGGDVRSVLSDVLHNIAENIKAPPTITQTGGSPTNGMPNS